MMIPLLGMRIMGSFRSFFFTAADIATSADGARSVFAADMDGMEIWILYRLLKMMIPLLGMRIMELQILLGLD